MAMNAKQNIPDWKKRKLVIRILLVLIVAGFVWNHYQPKSSSPHIKTEQELAAQNPSNIDDNADNEAPPASPTMTTQTLRPALSAEEIKDLRTQIRKSLAELYAAENAFHNETGYYSTDLINVGWKPTEAKMKFKVGFVQASVEETPDTNPLRLDSDAFLTEKSDTAENYQYLPTGVGIDLTPFAKLCPNGCSADQNGFEMLAVANLDDDATLDVWLMNNTREVLHLIDDTKE